MRLEIASVRIDLAARREVRKLADRYGGFDGARGTAHWTFELEPTGPAPLGSYSGRVVRRGNVLEVEGLEHLGSLDTAGRRGQAKADPLLAVVDALVRAALQLDVLGRGGVLVHAAAVVVDGRVHLFPGKSGSGKSTLAALAGRPLCDELCAIVPSRKGFEVHATPWWGTRPASAPLGAVYALDHGDAGVTALAQQQALRHLASNLVLPVDGPAEREAAFAAAARVAAAAPFGRLAFRIDSDVDALLRRAGLARAA